MVIRPGRRSASVPPLDPFRDDQNRIRKKPGSAGLAWVAWVWSRCPFAPFPVPFPRPSPPPPFVFDRPLRGNTPVLSRFAFFYVFHLFELVEYSKSHSTYPLTLLPFFVVELAKGHVATSLSHPPFVFASSQTPFAGCSDTHPLWYLALVFLPYSHLSVLSIRTTHPYLSYTFRDSGWTNRSTKPTTVAAPSTWT
jgi:hypothetical protein